MTIISSISIDIKETTTMSNDFNFEQIIKLFDYQCFPMYNFVDLGRWIGDFIEIN